MWQRANARVSLVVRVEDEINRYLWLQFSVGNVGSVYLKVITIALTVNNTIIRPFTLHSLHWF